MGVSENVTEKKTEPGCYCGQLQDHRKTCSSVIPLHGVGSQLLVSVSHRLVAASGEREFPYLT